VTGPRTPVPLIAVCCKLVHDRVDVDLLTGAVRVEPNSSGMSAADQAALEWALRIADSSGGTVLAVAAGPPESEQVLRDAAAAGASRLVRVDVLPNTTSAVTASALAGVLGDAAVVLCGDASLDRGTGAVPAFLAGELGAEQALGLVAVHMPEDTRATSLSLRVERRLDRGRREHLVVSAPCVLSVEAHTARLRRAPFDAVLSARGAAVEVALVRGSSARPRGAKEAATVRGGSLPVRTGPYSPRARVVPAPAGSLSARERIVALTRSDAGGRGSPLTLRLPAGQAALVLLETLDAWGELPRLPELGASSDEPRSDPPRRLP